MIKAAQLFRAAGHAGLALRRTLLHEKRGGAMILMYHSVSDATYLPDPYGITPANLTAQLEFVSRHFILISMEELANDIDAGKVRPGTAVITFDDGYANNADVAAPILDRLGVPATFNITTSNMLQGKPFWWERFRRLVYLDGRSEQPLAVSSPSVLESVWPEHGARLSKPGAEHRIREELKFMRPQERDDALDDIEARLASLVDLAEYPLNLPLSVDQLKVLAGNPLFTVAAHTVGHPVLRALSSADRLSEIEGSKRTLETIIGGTVEHMALPYGTSWAYDDDCIGIARSCGFRTVTTTSHDAVYSGADPMRLPRFGSKDVGTKHFGALIRWWLTSR